MKDSFERALRRGRETFGAFTIVKKLGEGARSIVYSAKRDGVDRTLKVLRRAA